jgi:DNA-binding IclR family transcriptional regulator
MLSSLSKALDIIELLAGARRPLALAEIARKLQMAKSSVHEVLSTLASRGFVQRQSGGIYELGVRSWEIGTAAAIAPLISSARPVMQNIAAKVNEDVVLGVLAGFESINVHIAGSGQAVRVYAPVGMRFPAHHASTGLALLAYQPEEYLDREMPRSLSAATRLTITDPIRLRSELKRIRARGYAINVGGWQIDVSGIAAPVLDREDIAIAALCVAAPRYRATRAWIRRVLPAVVRGAREITTTLSERRPTRIERLVS